MVQCNCVTLKGTRCKNAAVGMSSKCSVHSKKCTGTKAGKSAPKKRPVKRATKKVVRPKSSKTTLFPNAKSDAAKLRSAFSKKERKRETIVRHASPEIIGSKLTANAKNELEKEKLMAYLRDKVSKSASKYKTREEWEKAYNALQ